MTPPNSADENRLPGTFAADFARDSLALFVLLPVLRLYELLATMAHGAAANAVDVVGWGVLRDLVLPLWIAAVLALPIGLLAIASPTLARRVHRALIVFLVLLSVVCVRYYAITSVPLGADVFGYSWAMARKSVLASNALGIGAIAVGIAFIGLTWYVIRVFARLTMSRRGTGLFYACVVAAVLFHDAFDPGSLESAAPSRVVSADKAMIFVRQTEAFLIAQLSDPDAVDSLDAAPGDRGAESGDNFATRLPPYPLLHAATHDDVLGPFFRIGTRRPNIVLILVEGLGREFMGPGAPYGGFTPFLDSLAARSLYWENFLSTTGRTFGAFPSTLGSLPFGATGFMDLGARMPPHMTLVSLLGSRGYTTEYFSGTDGHFDNLDVFMERQNITRFMDGSSFPSGYEKQPGEMGFSWGYGDQDLFRHYLDVIGLPGPQPRLDILQTVTTHEPFLAPRLAEYQEKFERQLAALPANAARDDQFRRNAGVFETLLYVDDGLRWLFEEYTKRPNYRHTIFIITGDHRLNPLPVLSPISQFHVPLIIYSQLLKRPRRMASVSSHLDITPSLLAMLGREYRMSFPDTVPWLGSGLDTARLFRNVHSLAFMRTKNRLEDFIDRDHFLSQGHLFDVGPGLELSVSDDRRALAATRSRLDAFIAVNRAVTTGPRIMPGNAAVVTGAGWTARESNVVQDDSVFAALRLNGVAPARAFEIARDKAFARQYGVARSILLRLLRDAPNGLEMRALLARTYAWDQRFDDARSILAELIQRRPEYASGYAAMVEVESWSGRGEAALAFADSARRRFPLDVEVLIAKATALETLGRRREALAALDTVRAIDPVNSEALVIRNRLKR